MFKVIRLPTKFSRTINRFTYQEKAELLGELMKIWNWEPITLSDDIVWDTISLIYGEWMNMESKNGNKPEKSLIKYPSESVAKVVPSKSVTRVEENRVEESRIDNSIIINNNTTTEVEKFWKEEINNMQSIIKETIENNGMIYKAWTRERQRIQNILTWKDFWKNCEKAGMSRKDFVINIINLATKLKYWKPINNWADLYANYAAVYNKAVKAKHEILEVKRQIW